MKRNRVRVGLLALGLLLTPLTAGAEQQDRWLHIRVQESGDASVSVNLPLSVLGTAAEIVPEDVRRMEVEGADVTVEDLRAMWQELRVHPNEELVKVDEPDQKVVVSMVDGYLRVDATGRDNVQVRIPTEVVDALFSGEGDELEIGKALEMLAQSGSQELVTVEGDNEKVRIWVDSLPQGGES